MTTVETSFSEETRERALEILGRYPADRVRSALLPLLHLVQSEEGYVSPAGIEFCAEILGITKAQVGAVATFYTMFKRRPAGDWLVSVCTNTMCNVLGGQAVYDTLSEHLGVGHDETTEDGQITFEHAECLAACDYGPVMTVNYEFFDQVDPETAVGLVDELRAGRRPQPSRGARLCTLKEVSVQLAGFPDAREGAVGEGVPGEPTLRGLRLAQEHGIAVRGFDPNTPIKRKDNPPSADAKPAPEPEHKAAPAPATKTAPDVAGKKDPQVRTAEVRQPDAKTPATDRAATQRPVDRAPVPQSPGGAAATAAGAASSTPASDAKPAGDTKPADPYERNLEAADAEVGKERSQEADT